MRDLSQKLFGGERGKLVGLVASIADICKNLKYNSRSHILWLHFRHEKFFWKDRIVIAIGITALGGTNWVLNHVSNAI